MASPKEKVTAAQATAAAMRKDILAVGKHGEFLGSEDELLERYSVSRPTLRQAARILEHEQLLTVRRGVNGGMFTRLPTSQAVTRVAAVFLQANATTVHELLTAVNAITPAIARMAAENPSAKARRTLLDWVNSYQHELASIRPRGFYQVVAEFGTRLAQLAECPPLELFESVLVELSNAETSVNVFAARERIEAVNGHHLALAAAVRDGEAAYAEQLSRAQAERSTTWLGRSERRMRHSATLA